MARRLLPLLLLAALACQAWTDGPKPKPKPPKVKTVVIGKVTWLVDYDQALARAKRLNKPLWLHFGENPG